jgi:hypothetical protein
MDRGFQFNNFIIDFIMDNGAWLSIELVTWGEVWEDFEVMVNEDDGDLDGGEGEDMVGGMVGEWGGTADGAGLILMEGDGFGMGVPEWDFFHFFIIYIIIL